MQKRINYYFWQTYDGAEIDLLEESGGKLETFEFKWKSKKHIRIPDSFEKKYGKNHFFELINN